MSTDRDVTRIVRSWLDEGVTMLPDRVLDLVLDQLPATPQRRAGWLARRLPIMNSNIFRVGIAAAAVVLAVFLGIRFIGPNVGSDGPSPTPMASPRALPALGELEPGTYLVSNPDWTPVAFTVSVPAGWSIDIDGFINKDREGPSEVAFSPWIITHVFAHACTRPEGDAADLVAVGPTVDDLATALAGQLEREIVGPTDTVLAGYAAKRIELRAPADLSSCEFLMRTWADPGGNPAGGWSGRAGQTDVVYVLDVGGERFVMNTWHFPGTSETDLTELETILASIRIQP